MGNTVIHSYIKSNILNKRKASVFDSDLESENNEDFYDTEPYDSNAKRCSQREKRAKTSKYIFKTLFEDQQGSDITIKALDRTWKLHKLYLSQSLYFYTMFNGDWLETEKKEIELQIDDANVTADALHKVFSSFYQDEIQIKPHEAVPIIGAACLLQMDDLSQQCIQVMKRNVNMETAVSYYEAADFYSLKQLKDIAFDWLLKNLLYKIKESPVHLKEISCDLMTSLIESSNLVMIQTEFSAYLMLKMWLFLKESNCTVHNDMKTDKLANEYFKNAGTSPYLLTSNGQKYQKAFLAMRRQHLISHSVDLQVIERDNIMPAEWFTPIYKQKWYSMLQIEEGVDTGPSNVSEEDFNKHCARVGRILKQDKETHWRWTGFNYGYDLIVNYNKGSVHLSRNQDFSLWHSSELRALKEVLFKDKKRSIMYRIGVYSRDKKGKVISKQETKIESISLEFGQQKQVMMFDCEMKFPVIFSANFLVITPPSEKSQENSSIDIEDIQTFA